MRTRFTIALALSLLVLLAGCGKGSKLVGTWTTTQGGTPAEVTFSPDGTATAVVTIKDGPMAGAVVNIKASYKEDGDKLHMTTTDATVSNFPAIAKGKEAEVTDAVKKQAEVGKEKIDSIKWNSDTSFTTTGDKGSATFTKKA